MVTWPELEHTWTRFGVKQQGGLLVGTEMSNFKVPDEKTNTFSLIL